jgi:SAM-dependent methyltransferase
LNNESIDHSAISVEISKFCANIPKGPIYLAEAQFGLQQILPYLEQLSAGSRVLEVGSGPCIALSTMAERYQDLHFQGVEPMGSGFAIFEKFIDELNSGSQPFALFKGGYEEFQSTGNWDLVFLVNVFEHLPDWRNFLNFLCDNLSPGGKCIVLCPNYSFPYESHFRLPIFLNKNLTRTVFRKKIEKFEAVNGWDGLFDSLNFVKLRKVRRAIAEAGLYMTVHPQIILQMIDRLESDAEFAARQRAITSIAKLAKHSGMLEWLLKKAIIQDIMPYMKLEISLQQ